MNNIERIDFYNDVKRKIQSYNEKIQEKEFKELNKKVSRGEQTIFQSLQYDDFDREEQGGYYIDRCINNDDDLKHIIEMLSIIIERINGKISDYEKFESIEKMGSCLFMKEKVSKILKYLLQKK